MATKWNSKHDKDGPAAAAAVAADDGDEHKDVPYRAVLYVVED